REIAAAAPNTVLTKSLRLEKSMDLKFILKYLIWQGCAVPVLAVCLGRELTRTSTCLLDPQRFPRINPRGASRRKIAGHCRGGDQDNRNRRIRFPVEGSNPEQQSSHQTVQSN